eukprot:139255-Pelagomonas_calceolata.AAC.1
MYANKLQGHFKATRRAIENNFKNTSRSQVMEPALWWRGFKAPPSQCVPFSLIDLGRVSSAYVVFLFSFLSPYILPKYSYSDLPKHVVRSVAQFHLRLHTLKVEQATWDDAVSPTCDLCDAQDDVQDEQHDILKCTHPH